MKADINKMIWCEYHSPDNKSHLKAQTDSNGKGLVLIEYSVQDGERSYKRITLSDDEFDKLAKELGYKKEKYFSMNEILNDDEFYLVDDGI